MAKSTAAQKIIAFRYGIPLSHAHTVNIKKADAFFRWQRSAAGIVEEVVYRLYLKRLLFQQTEWMGNN